MIFKKPKAKIPIQIWVPKAVSGTTNSLATNVAALKLFKLERAQN